MIELKPYQIEPGERYGTLTVLLESRRGSHKEHRVECDCSFVFFARGSKLRKGLVKCRRCSSGR